MPMVIPYIPALLMAAGASAYWVAAAVIVAPVYGAGCPISKQSEVEVRNEPN